METSYVEAHGTGTRAGDPVEAAAIAKAIAQDRPLDQPLTIGSVKANVGHLEGASGITGVIKCVLMHENGVIIPNRTFENSNERIPLHEWKLKVRGLLMVESHPALNWLTTKSRYPPSSSLGILKALVAFL